MTDRWKKQAYDLGTDIRSMVAMSGVDPIHHIPEVDDAIAAALSAAHEAGRREERERSANMHRRAQKAEGKLMRMEAAHADACEYAFRTHIDYTLYGSLLLNMNQSLFPKLTPAAIRSREVKP